MVVLKVTEAFSVFLGMRKPNRQAGSKKNGLRKKGGFYGEILDQKCHMILTSHLI